MRFESRPLLVGIGIAVIAAVAVSLGVWGLGSVLGLEDPRTLGILVGLLLGALAGGLAAGSISSRPVFHGAFVGLMWGAIVMLYSQADGSPASLGARTGTLVLALVVGAIGGGIITRRRRSITSPSASSPDDRRQPPEESPDSIGHDAG